MPSAEARSALTTVSPTPGVGPLRPEPPSVVPPKAAALPKSTSQTLTLGSALRVPPLPVVAAAWSPRTVSRPSTCGSPRRRSRRRAASSPWTIVGEATISSIGPRLSYAPCLTEKLSVSPTIRLPMMIAVPSTEPATTRVASPRRRATWRKASLRRNGRRTAMYAATAAQMTSKVTRRGVRSGYMAQTRDRRADAGVVGHQHDRLPLDVVQLVEQLDDLVRHAAVEIAGRLVRPHDHRSGGQRPGDRDPLLLAAGQLVRPVPGAAAEPDTLQHLGRPLLRLACRRAGEQQGKLHVLGRGEDWDQVERLEDEAHRLCAMGRPGGVGHLE